MMNLELLKGHSDQEMCVLVTPGVQGQIQERVVLPHLFIESHTHFPKTTHIMTHLMGRAQVLAIEICTADLISRLEECVSASSVSVCWYLLVHS